MARIAGVDLPRNKRVEIGLTYIYGVGRSRSREILKKVNVDFDKKISDLTDHEVDAIRKIVVNDYIIEGDLRTQTKLAIKRLMDLGCYRGMRHRKGLPCRGQNTKNNARTRKGKKKQAVKNKKK
ncbi:MAG: 30S ribosomal protein S13 [Candidatus Cloacimonadota bacterium]|nr:MAG: 30S ribosomal protein S13 [Candidatus Cloacimonadota bacterium]PIE79143.1 MAG: 30S ribosomal protein S13 [Candidatus Delongbacteria bacterium]